MYPHFVKIWVYPEANLWVDCYCLKRSLVNNIVHDINANNFQRMMCLKFNDTGWR